jgi:hypothetical protein
MSSFFFPSNARYNKELLVFEYLIKFYFKRKIMVESNQNEELEKLMPELKQLFSQDEKSSMVLLVAKGKIEK